MEREINVFFDYKVPVEEKISDRDKYLQADEKEIELDDQPPYRSQYELDGDHIRLLRDRLIKARKKIEQLELEEK